ncbi:purine nucleoside phosphorylase-like isoform X1 [Amphibalanus amphitrite]|uniref:purine nucleoside phosphorylase-like isoform X1 n=1 Tax=Amphibalanus amphitrite TaxID=1232801 RepID=UPI001C8FAAFE|nr:purine nucleoside phosphorylase-like isoform X1 [Amphibalanus amphitrite]
MALLDLWSAGGAAVLQSQQRRDGGRTLTDRYRRTTQRGRYRRQLDRQPAAATMAAEPASDLEFRAAEPDKGSPRPLRALASGGGSMCLEHTLPGEAAFDYNTISISANYLLERTKHRPAIGIVCGSGLGSLVDHLKEREAFPYEKIPNFPVSTVAGHDGQVVFGLLNGVPVMCMKGRFHSYEGYPLWKTAMPIRVMKLVGVNSVIVTNAAGGINDKYHVGDVMLIKDHINIPGFAGNSPLVGKNDENFGPRFPGMSNAYDKQLRQEAKNVVKEMGIEESVHEGVYVMLGGPSYETVAELRLLRLLGADAVGMSTVAEVVVARHCGMRVFAFSLVTNKCIMEWDSDEEANHEEVIAAANARKHHLQELVGRMAARMAQ